MKTLFIILLPLLLFSKSYKVSPIPLPKSYVQNLDIYPCDLTCRQELLKHGFIFSYLAYANEGTTYPSLNESRLTYNSLFNIGPKHTQAQFKIALLLPSSKIGRYAASTTNSVFAYMLSKNRAFEMETFEIADESLSNIDNALEQIYAKGFYTVIAPLTKAGANNLVHANIQASVYIPTVNKKDIKSRNIMPNIYFGGIDYQAQIESLLSYSTTPLVIFKDQSPLAKELHDSTKIAYFSSRHNQSRSMDEIYTDELETLEDKNLITITINKNSTNLERYLKNNPKIQHASFFLDTPIVKSSLIMSQLTLYDVNKSNILSTQINYDPLLFSMTQYKDRSKMLIANSITNINKHLSETNTLFNNDINYDWINYSTTVGIDYLYAQAFKEPRLYKLKLIDNQIRYPVVLMKPSFSRFSIYAKEPY